MREVGRGLKLINAIGFIALATYPLSSSYSGGYQYSILNTYPFWYRLSIYIVLVVSMFLLVNGTHRKALDQIAMGIGSIMAWTGIFYMLPLFRGYRFGTTGGDMFYHLGIVRTIAAEGGLVTDSVYPMAYSWFSIIQIVTGLELLMLTVVIALFSRVMLSLFIGGLAYRYWGLSGLLYGFLASTPLIYGKFLRGLFPFFLALILLPLLIHLVDGLQSNRRKYRAYSLACIIVLLGIALLHPMTGVLSLPILALYLIFDTAGYKPQFSTPRYLLAVAAALVGLAFYLQVGLQQALRTVLVGVFADQSAIAQQPTGATLSPLQIFLQAFSDSDVPVRHIIWDYFIAEFGAVLLYGAAAGLTTLYIAWRFWQGESSRHAVVLCGLYLTGLLIAGVLLVTNIIAPGPIRIGQIAIMFAILLVVFALHRSDITSQTTVNGVLVAVVVISALLSTGMAYPSNHHTSESTITGTDWSIEYQDLELHTVSSLDRKVIYYQLGSDAARTTPLVFGTNANPELDLPRRLGYDRNETIHTSVPGRAYIIVRDQDQKQHLAYPENQWDSLGIFILEEDVHRLRSDNTSHQIYTSGRYGVWKTIE